MSSSSTRVLVSWVCVQATSPMVSIVLLRRVVKSGWSPPHPFLYVAMYAALPSLASLLHLMHASYRHRSGVAAELRVRAPLLRGADYTLLFVWQCAAHLLAALAISQALLTAPLFIVVARLDILLASLLAFLTTTCGSKCRRRKTTSLGDGDVDSSPSPSPSLQSQSPAYEAPLSPVFVFAAPAPSQSSCGPGVAVLIVMLGVACYVGISYDSSSSGLPFGIAFSTKLVRGCAYVLGSRLCHVVHVALSRHLMRRNALLAVEQVPGRSRYLAGAAGQLAGESEVYKLKEIMASPTYRCTAIGMGRAHSVELALYGGLMGLCPAAVLAFFGYMFATSQPATPQSVFSGMGISVPIQLGVISLCALLHPYFVATFALQCEERTYAVAESLDTVLPVLGALLAVTQDSSSFETPQMAGLALILGAALIQSWARGTSLTEHQNMERLEFLAQALPEISAPRLHELLERGTAVGQQVFERLVAEAAFGGGVPEMPPPNWAVVDVVQLNPTLVKARDNEQERDLLKKRGGRARPLLTARSLTPSTVLGRSPSPSWASMSDPASPSVGDHASDALELETVEAQIEPEPSEFDVIASGNGMDSGLQEEAGLLAPADAKA